MKKFFFPLLAAFAMILSVSSCGSPVDKFLDKLGAFQEFEDKLGDNDDLSKKDMAKFTKLVKDLAEFIDENEDYKLKDKDRDAVIDYSIDMLKKHGQVIDKEDIEEIKEEGKGALKNVKTLGNLVYMMNLDFDEILEDLEED